ncbi:MAG: hypothetical protein BHW58_00350 [Azospirillum sp. 51_20]|nr:MAG: hypothetical protein BHW58_00350 [Azospirillum sp. 51_20]
MTKKMPTDLFLSYGQTRQNAGRTDGRPRTASFSPPAAVLRRFAKNFYKKNIFCHKAQTPGRQQIAGISRPEASEQTANS